MVSRALARASLRHFARHRWQTLLAVAGIGLGVAVVVAVDIANSSARRAFGLTLERIAGRATHQIEAASGAIPEELYTRVRVDHGVDTATPLIEGTVRIAGEPFTLLGVDPFSQGAFRDRSWRLRASDTANLLSSPDGALLSGTDAARLGLGVGDPITLEARDRTLTVRLRGTLESEDAAGASGLVVADIAAAQDILERVGGIDRIDLILSDEAAARLASALPAGLRLVPAARRSAALTSMTDAFHLNLSAMSLLAVLVGAFIIYNAMTFSVLQRRHLLGTLRTLGVTRGQLFGLVMLESLALGVVGVLLGLALGVVTGRGLVQLVTRTINDLYFTVTVRQFFLDAAPLVGGALIGLATTLGAAAVPALEAARAEPRDALRRTLVERKSGHLLPWLTLAGCALIIGGLSLAAAPGGSLTLGFVALFLVILGYCLVVPHLSAGLWTGVGRVVGNRLGYGFRLALRGLAGSVGRTGVAIAALTLAVAASVGVGVMIGSFRSSVADWLDVTLRSDLYVSAASDRSSATGGRLPEGIEQRIRALPGVAEISTGRSIRIDSQEGPVVLLAIDPSSRSHRGFQFKGPVLEGLWERFRAGELILVSEPYAHRTGLTTGDPLELLTVEGPRTFTIGGVFHDYGSDRGMLLLPRNLYAALWRDPQISTVGVAVTDPAQTEDVAQQIRSLAKNLDETIQVRSNRAIREQSLEIFDRTFTVTRVLRLLALGVAFIGILSALLALQIERSRDYAILRASGVTPRELSMLILTQTGLVGAAACLFAIPLGILMADLLIEVVNLRSFGWTIHTRLSVLSVLGSASLALVAALLAGVYPAWRVAGAEPAAALREE